RPTIHPRPLTAPLARANPHPPCNVAQGPGPAPGPVSQILTRVRRWRARGAGFQPAENNKQSSDVALDATFSALEQQRLQRHLAKFRHEYLYEICIRELHRMSENPKHTTTRTESKPCEDEADCQSAICNPQSAIGK